MGLGSKQSSASTGDLTRALALGIASGTRSSLGLCAPALFGKPAAYGRRRLTRIASVGGELVVDKLPQTPSRLEPPALAARLISGAAGAFVLARRELVAPPLPMLAGVAGAAVGAYGGAAWRMRSGAVRPDWQGALAEDVKAIALAWWACRVR